MAQQSLKKKPDFERRSRGKASVKDREPIIYGLNTGQNYLSLS
jgi:hypothetical protein